jgi:HAD superfamily hydrolase (TIGR01509 family)
MRPIAHKTTFLFDLDGTLVDSSPLHELAFHEVIRHYHPELAESFDYERMKGRRTRDVFLALGLTEETRLAELVTAKQAHYRASVQQGRVVLCPGTMRVLALLRAAGRRLFVVTGASRASAEQVLESCGIRAFFEGIVSADEVLHSKPHPQIFLHCLETYRLDRKASLVVEDALSGAMGARAAGIDVVLVHNSDPAEMFPAFDDLHAFAAFLTANLVRRSATGSSVDSAECGELEVLKPPTDFCRRVLEREL